MFAVTILGNNSAVPAFDRHPTAQVLQTNETTFLIDCGEGTQMQMSRYKIRRNKIDHIFISHLHGDHYFGLIGLLSSMGLTGRKNELHIYAPEQLKNIIDLQLSVANTQLPYDLNFHILQNESVIKDGARVIVECFKVKHRIECWGFIFREKKNRRKIVPEEVKKYNIPTSFYENLQRGENFVNESKEVIKNDMLTIALPSPKIYAYCADTIYYEPLIEKVRNADLLYHETTYLHTSQKKAIERFHSTAKEAAMIAKKAGVKKLLIGHFSSMYETLDDFEKEACEVFKNTEIANEGCTYLI
ncbi:MAG: ribonuclease Z [Ginsengibacter sp.]